MSKHPVNLNEDLERLESQLVGSDGDYEDDEEVIVDNVVVEQPKPKPRKKVARKEAAPQPKGKQKTLAQTMSEKDVNRLFQSASNVKTEDDMDDVAGIDFSKYMRDDDVDSSEEVPDILGEGSREEVAEASGQEEKPVSPVPASVAVPSTPAISTEGACGDHTVIKLEDEQYHFEDGHEGKKRPIKRAQAVSNHSSYVSTEKVNKELTLNANALATDYPTPDKMAAKTETIMPAPTGDAMVFYWLDMKEQHHSLSVDPGSVFLFGKMLYTQGQRHMYKSCCIRVRNVERCTFLLPREGSSEMDVVKEINEHCKKQGIEQRRIKFVKRYYAFEKPNIPRENSTWAKLRFPGMFPPLAGSHFQHISAVMGANTSLQELFLIKRKIKGPCFLSITGLSAATQRISHCDLEFTVDNPKNIVVEETNRPSPPLCIASIQLHSQLDEQGAQSEICAVAIAVYPDANVDESLRTNPKDVLIGVRPVTGSVIPFDFQSFCAGKGLRSVNTFRDEVALLAWVAAQLKSIDADILVGHNFFGYTLDTLLRRYNELNILGWSSLGRLDLKKPPRFNSTNMNQEREVCVGRLIADSYLLAREYYKSVNYKLQSLASQMSLKGIASGDSSFEAGMTVLTPDTFGDNKVLFDIILQVANASVLSMSVLSHLDAVRLTKRLSSIAGNLWSRTLNGGRSERIEYLLLHAFHDLKFIVPDKYSFDVKREREEDDDGKRKAKYQGGMVLEPKVGLYSEYILLLDFNSLYPSLIQEFNICFTTVERSGDEEAGIPPPENLICRDCAAAKLSAPCLHKCILPKVIKGLVDSRREVKRLMKSERDANSLALLEIRQKALKLTANSMYGCLGFVHSRFQAQPLAELVTRQGRLALQNTVDLIPQIDPSLRVIYGDTDSVMIQSGIKDDIKRVRDLGVEIKNKVNKKYQSLEIDIDGVFRAILLLKKKKYAALTVVDWQGNGTQLKQEVKGLDMVRRDWCPLSKSVSDAVLKRVLNAEGSEDILDYIMNYLRDVADHIRLGDRYTLEDFVISKSLTKEPESYKGTGFPHATVALRMKQRKELVRVGDLIPYVICEGEKLNEKAYHVDEVRNDKKLHIDAEWYISTQIYPPILRLCEHIQGFSAAQLSEAMGLEYHASGAANGNNEEDEAVVTGDFSHCGLFQNRSLSECFPNVLPFQVLCKYCKRKTPIDPHQRVLDVLASGGSASREQFDLYVCTSCNRALPIEFVANSFVQTCYFILRQFYESGGGARAVRSLRTQFTYFRALFDVPRAPGCSVRVKECHRCRAKRCVDVSGKVLTLQEAEDPDVPKDDDAVDPLKESAEAFYKRISHLFINLEALFKRESRQHT